MPVIVNTRTAPASAGEINLTGQAFVTGVCGGTVLTPTLVRSLADFEAAFATRTGPSIPMWDWLDVFFREGGKQAWVCSYAVTGGYAPALALFDLEKGPGQVALVGEVPTATTMAALATHALANGRFAVPDVASGATLSAMNTMGDGVPVDTSAQVMELVGPWLNYPAPVGITGGAERLVPASAALCGVCARVDADGNPNRAPGGPDYALQYCDGPSLASAESDRDAAVTHHVNLVRVSNGVIQFDSAQTGIVQDPATPFWQANCARARMYMRAASRAIGLNYYMKSIDAEGHLAGALANDLKAMLLDLYNADGLFGLTPADAFDVNVGSTVNTTATSANATLVAVCQAKLSLYAKTVQIDLVTVPILGQVVNS